MTSFLDTVLDQGLAQPPQFSQRVCSLAASALPSAWFHRVGWLCGTDGLLPATPGQEQQMERQDSGPPLFSVGDWLLLALSLSVIGVWIWFFRPRSFRDLISASKPQPAASVPGPRPAPQAVASSRPPVSQGSSGVASSHRRTDTASSHDSDASIDSSPPPLHRDPRRATANVALTDNAEEGVKAPRKIPSPPKPPPRTGAEIPSGSARSLTVPKRNKELPAAPTASAAPQQPSTRRPRGASRVLLERIIHDGPDRAGNAAKAEHTAEDRLVEENKKNGNHNHNGGEEELLVPTLGPDERREEPLTEPVSPPSGTPVSPMLRQRTEPPHALSSPEQAELPPCDTMPDPVPTPLHTAATRTADPSPSPERMESALKALANDRSRHHCPLLQCWLMDAEHNLSTHPNAVGPSVVRLACEDDVLVDGCNASRPRCWRGDDKLSEGDVILAVNGKRTATVAQVQDAILDMRKAQHLLALTILHTGGHPDREEGCSGKLGSDDETRPPSEAPPLTPTLLILPVRQPRNRQDGSDLATDGR